MTQNTPESVAVEALLSIIGKIDVQAGCLEGYAEQSGHSAKPIPSVFHFQASHFRDIAKELRAAISYPAKRDEGAPLVFYDSADQARRLDGPADALERSADGRISVGNAALAASDLRALTPANGDAMRVAELLAAQGQFLLDRIDNLEWADDGYDDLCRDWNGHVDPALSRFRATLATLTKDQA